MVDLNKFYTNRIDRNFIQFKILVSNNILFNTTKQFIFNIQYSICNHHSLRMADKVLYATVYASAAIVHSNDAAKRNKSNRKFKRSKSRL
jgi:uncharacterized protein